MKNESKEFSVLINEREQLLKAKMLDQLEIERLEFELESAPQFRKIQELRAKNALSVKLLKKLDNDFVEANVDIWKQQ